MGLLTAGSKKKWEEIDDAREAERLIQREGGSEKKRDVNGEKERMCCR